MYRLVQQFLNRSTSLFRRSRRQHELDLEIQGHIELLTERNIEAGMSPEAAKKAALKRFGSTEKLKEDCRDSWGTRIVAELIRDIRFGLRLMRLNWGSSVMAVLLMAIGLGVTITIFTYVNGFLWSKVDTGSSEKMLHLEWAQGPGVGSDDGIIPEDYLVFEKELQSFKHIAGFRSQEVALHNPSGESFNKQYSNCETSWSFFDTIGVPPLLGRTYNQSDEIPGGSGSPGIAVISHSIWQEQFSGDRDAVGSNIYLDGILYEVIGVMPEGFSFPRDQDVWFPSYWQWSLRLGRNRGPSLDVVGVIDERFTRAQAQTELDLLAGRFADQHPETNEFKTRVAMKPFEEEALGDQFSNLLFAMLVCSTLVLLVACVNVFNLIMARASKRSGELALRSVLGASRSHLIVQVLVDGFIISACGLGLGLWLASWGSDYVWERISQEDLYFWWHMNMDGRVIAFAVSVTVGAAIVSSLIPAVRASKSASYGIVKDDTRTSSGYFIGRLSKALVVMQVVFSSLLVFTAIVMIIISIRMDRRDFPYDTDKVLMSSIVLDVRYGEMEAVHAFIEDFREELKGVPGVRDVEVTTMNGARFDSTLPFEILGEAYDVPEDRPSAVRSGILPGFFDIFGEAPLRGRMFNQFDTKDSEPVCIINKTLADRFWPEGDAVGKMIRIGSSRAFREYASNPDELPWVKIVGIAPDILPPRIPGERIEKFHFVYRPFQQSDARFINLLVTGEGDVKNYINDLRRSVEHVAPYLMPMDIQTIREFNDRLLVGQSVITSLFFVFGVAALFKATIGVYAVVSFATRQKTREIGIRRALGSDNLSIAKLALQQNWLGLSVGCLLGMVAGHFVSAHLGNVLNTDELPIGYAYPTVVVVMVFAALFSFGIPVRRAIRVSPMKALAES